MIYWKCCEKLKDTSDDRWKHYVRYMVDVWLLIEGSGSWAWWKEVNSNNRVGTQQKHIHKPCSINSDRFSGNTKKSAAVLQSMVYCCRCLLWKVCSHRVRENHSGGDFIASKQECCNVCNKEQQIYNYFLDQLKWLQHHFSQTTVMVWWFWSNHCNLKTTLQEIISGTNNMIHSIGHSDSSHTKYEHGDSTFIIHWYTSTILSD